MFANTENDIQNDMNVHKLYIIYKACSHIKNETLAGRHHIGGSLSKYFEVLIQLVSENVTSTMKKLPRVNIS